MTGTEELNFRLAAMGCGKAGLNSKVIPMMLAIFASEDHPDAWEILQEKIAEADEERRLLLNERNQMDEEEREIHQKELKIRQKEEILKVHEQEIIAQKKEIEDRKKELEDSNSWIAEQMAEMETAEMRDKARALKVYNASIPKNLNEYQMTEYVKGVAIILGN